MKQSRRELKSKYTALQQKVAEINQKMDDCPTGPERTKLQNEREQCQADIDRLNSQWRILNLYASRRKWILVGYLWVLLFSGIYCYKIYQSNVQQDSDILDKYYQVSCIICGIMAGNALGRATRINRMIRDEKSQTH